MIYKSSHPHTDLESLHFEPIHQKIFCYAQPVLKHSITECDTSLYSYTIIAFAPSRYICYPIALLYAARFGHTITE